MPGYIAINSRYAALSAALAIREAHRCLNELSQTVLPVYGARVSPATVPAFYIVGSTVYQLADSVALGYSPDRKTIVSSFTSPNFTVGYFDEKPPQALPIRGS